MQRVEPRELVAAGVCAALPLAYWLFAAWGGGPDVLDSASGGGAVVATSIVREWLTGKAIIGSAGSFGREPFFPAAPLLSLVAAALPVGALAATRASVALALWVCGYGGYRLARTAAPGSGLVGGYSIAIGAQIAAGRATLEADLPAFTAGFVLLALAHASTGFVVGLMGLPAASAVVTIGAVRRRPLLLLGAVGLAGLYFGATSLPGGARRVALPKAIVPAYGTAVGAWFPMPPAEAAFWTKIEGRSGLWLHPQAQILVESGGVQGQDEPTADAESPAGAEAAAASVQASLESGRNALESRVNAQLPIIEEERQAIGRGTMLSPLGAVLLFVALRACERRKWGRFVPVVAGLLAIAGGILVWLREVRHDEGISGAELRGVVAQLQSRPAGEVLLMPPPAAPYFAGRLSADRWAGTLAAAGRLDASRQERGSGIALLSELSRKAEYGLDIQAAERAWASPPSARTLRAAAAVGVRYLIFDAGALSLSAQQVVSAGLAAESVVPVAVVGDFVVYDLGP